jgi:hypothetical protein
MGERERLIARIWQLGRGSTDGDARGKAATRAPRENELRALEARVTHLERLLEGLQDSVHRESTRVGKRVDELEARIQPGTLGRALSEDARERGL